MTDDGNTTVLVVDDEPDMTRLCEAWLSDAYDVRVANSGEDALERIDDTVDVVLLDRRMPDLLGRDVLAEIRDREYDCRVGMLTAVAPDTDIVDMGFDAYLTKPVDRAELRAAVDRLKTLSTYDDDVRQLYSLVEKRTKLEDTLSESRLGESETYETLLDRIGSLETRIDRDIETMDDGDFRSAFSNL